MVTKNNVPAEKSSGKKTSKKKKKLSKEERDFQARQRAHKNMVRRVFGNAGFRRFPKLADRQFTLSKQITSDFDDVFCFENVIVCAEYTVKDNVGEHLKPKKIVYDEVAQNPNDVINKFCVLDTDFKIYIEHSYSISEYIIVVVYCSRNEVRPDHKKIVDNVVYFDYPKIRYFKSITDCIRQSARPELLTFLGVDFRNVGEGGKISIHEEYDKFTASLLPEANSHFQEGYKVVSFYADPEALLKRSYVLRREGWRDSSGLYQRMISKKKIDSIRRYLKTKRRVFVNNIIATLDDDTWILDSQGNPIDPDQITKTQPVQIQVPKRANTVGLIDGQHRTFSYYEGTNDDPEIAKLRKRQNLLVTGIIYPKEESRTNREAFEGQLFLEINANQTNAKSNLKQAINNIVQPYSDESIAKTVVERLGRSGGPLGGEVEQYWFDTDKLKTTSVVSYGMRPLVKTKGDDTLFALWPNEQKMEMVSKAREDLREEYVQFCVDEINKFLSAVRKKLPKEKWTSSKKTKGRLITTTTINSLLICFRLMCRDGKVGTMDWYDSQLNGFGEVEFKGTHSSQYTRLGEEIYERYFK